MCFIWHVKGRRMLLSLSEEEPSPKSGRRILVRILGDEVGDEKTEEEGDETPFLQKDQKYSLKSPL